MSNPPEVNIKSGDKVGDRFVVKKKLGEGSCGQVWLVQDVKNEKFHAAMKIEAKMKNKDEEILKMEIYVLKKLQNSKYVCRFYMSGNQSNYSFVVMSLLGQDLTDLRRRCKDRKMQPSSALRIGIQALQALDDMHKAGFIHRDVKPTNLAMGHNSKHVLYLFDFGLARQIFLPDKAGKSVLRPPRNKVSFRGTVRYCSLNVHLAKEQGRHDDLWCVLHTLIECITGTLPWKGSGRKDAEKIKAGCKEDKLVKGCPKSFGIIFRELSKCSYFTEPGYSTMSKALVADFKPFNVKMVSPFEWENQKSTMGGKGGAAPSVNKDVKAEVDKDPDNDTSRDVDESAQSAVSEISNNESENEYDIENTLENIADVKESKRENK